MLVIRKLNFNLEQPLMSEIQKSGQRIKAKISKVPISHINSMQMVEITPPRRSLPLPLHNSTPSPSPPPPPPTIQEEEPVCVLNQERRQLLKYFGIPENYCSHIKFGDEYTHQICRDRISVFQGKQQLDPRDQRIRIPLSSQYLQKYLQGGAKDDMEPLLDEVRDWLIDLVQITCSVSVGELKRERFGNEQAKNFAAKNILLNVKEMFEGLEGTPLAQRFQIMKFVNAQAQRVMEETIMKYPQTSSRGASRRVQSKVRRIDNREDDQYDFLYRNGITIPYRKSGDYSEDIMRVLNKLIACPTDPFHPDAEDTNFEVFTEVMEYIFENSSSQTATNTAADIAQLIAMKTRPKGENYLLSSTNVTEMREVLSFSDRLDKKSGSGRELAAKDYLIAHKIPSGTPLFTEQQLEGGSFKVHDSSVLRILTKWAEELREKLSNAEEAIVKRAHRFKVRSGKLMGLEMNLKEQMYNAALLEEAKVKTYLQFLNKENTALQVVFSQEQNIGRHSKHDTKVGIFAAKMNEIASQYMFKYVNHLIHALRRVPRIAAAEIANQAEKNLLSSVDLVTLKIGDLLRSKYCCNEQEFVRVLGVLEEVDCKHPHIIRIVRIKNRLQKKDNDVLINLYFMDRIECELQLSIRSPHHPKHDHSAFNHFLYEVIRSKLGPLSELANIVTQYDPLIHHFKRMKQYGPPLLQQQWLKDKKKRILDSLVERLKFKRDTGVLRSLDLPFMCCKCFHLTIVTNPKFYYKAPGDLKLTCNQCSFSDMLQTCEHQSYAYMMEESFKDPEVRSFYQEHLQYWDFEEQLKSLQADGDDVCRMLNIPQQGFYLKKNSKLPKMALYSAMFDSVSNSYIFMTVNAKGISKPIITLPLYRQKKKRIEAFKKQLQSFYFFYFENARTRVDQGMLYVSCTKQGCCEKEIRAGPILTSTQISEYSHTKTINCSLNSQKSLLNLNGIPRALQRLDKALNLVDDPLKSERMARGVQIIRARACALQDIQVVKNFPNLIELNISNNHLIQSLRGLEECLQLRNLDCKGCDLMNIDQLMALRKLEHLNLKGNRRLKDLSGLDGHTQLLDLNIALTSVSSLEPLKDCLKLESLSIEGCTNIESLTNINSTALAYLNMVDCTSLEMFDLQLHSAKSLKSVQYVKSGREKIGFQLVMASLDYLAEDQGEDGQSHIATAVDIDRINQVLKHNKKKMDLSFLMHTVT